jgi:hypothetical protein
MSTSKAMLACPPMPVERGITVQEERTMNTQEESMMKGARYRSAIYLTGGGENSLDDALTLLTHALPEASEKELIKGFSIDLVEVPRPEVSYSSNRRNHLFTYGCESIKRVNAFEISEDSEGCPLITLALKTVGGFPDKWVTALSRQLPDWRIMVTYQSRDDHISRIQSGVNGKFETRYENTSFQLVDDALLAQASGVQPTH